MYINKSASISTNLRTDCIPIINYEPIIINNQYMQGISYYKINEKTFTFLTQFT